METNLIRRFVGSPQDLSPQPYRDIVIKLKDLLTNMAQNVTTIECLISSMSNAKDRHEVNDKMKETADKLNELLPLMQSYLQLPEPEDKAAKEKWWMQRERMNRDLEAFLHNFQLLHAVLGSKLEATPNESIAELLKTELKDMQGALPQFHDDIADVVAQAEQTLIVIVSEMNEKAPHPMTEAFENIDKEDGNQQRPEAIDAGHITSDEETASANTSPSKKDKAQKKRRMSNACRQS